MNPRIRVAAIIVEGDSVLLVRHRKGAETYWLLPGGGVDYGEALDEALKRELREEANLDVTVNELVFANDSIAPDGRRHILNLYFRAEIAGGELALGNDERTVEVRFMPVAALESLTLYPDIRAELSEAIAGGFPRTGVYLGSRWKP